MRTREESSGLPFVPEGQPDHEPAVGHADGAITFQWRGFPSLRLRREVREISVLRNCWPSGVRISVRRLKQETGSPCSQPTATRRSVTNFISSSPKKLAISVGFAGMINPIVRERVSLYRSELQFSALGDAPA